MYDLDTVLAALHAIRAPRTSSEYDLHALVSEALETKGLAFLHEARIAPRRRIDFLCGSVGLEIKRGRPASAALQRQLAAYAESPALSALVLVAERPPLLPSTLFGKPLCAVSLLRLWGVAL